MDIPTRIEIRGWLATMSRAEILERLATVKQSHGDQSEQDVRHFLNVERELCNKGGSLFPTAPKLELMSGEESLLNEHEQRKADIAADLKSRERLYGETTACLT